mgnify:CR=1 FL=1
MSWILLGLMGCGDQLEPDAWNPQEAEMVGDEVAQPVVLASGLDGPKGLAWWQEQLFVAEEDGGRVVSIEEGEVWVDDLSGPTWLAAEGDWLMIADSAAGAIELLGSDGSRRTLSEGHASIGRIALVNGQAWWLDPDAGELWSADTTDGSGYLVAESLDDPVGLSVLDGVPWVAEQESELLTEVDPETGESSTVAELEDPPHDLVREGDAAFLTSRSTRWPYGGFILSVHDDEVEELSYSPPEPERIGLTEDHVIWSSKQSITRVDRSGGTYELVSGMTAVEDFISLEGVIMWTDGQTGEILSW